MAGEEKPRLMMAASSGYCYSDASSTENPQIYNLTAPMEIVGFPFKNLISNQPINDLTTNHHSTMLSPVAWNHHHRLVVDDPSMRCVFSDDGNGRQSQGSLSLSLTSNIPSNTNLQSFELRHMTQQQFQIRSSKYLEPAKELLNQLCSLEIASSKMKNGEAQLRDDSAAVRAQPLPFTLDLLELQRRKTKLVQMLHEVEGRYTLYCDQMKAVVSSFDAVAGDGAAAAYSAMALRAISRHFRCLKDGIVSQVKATNMAMGEKDGAIPGATKGETPRLRILDVKLRQQRALQQMGMAENHPWRPQRGLPEKAVAVLRAWLFEHFLHPYPSEVDKRILARQTGLSRSQVSNWFINARVRLWKPMVEEMYMEDQKEEEGPSSGGATADLDTTNSHNPTTNEDRKPTQDQPMNRTDSECLSSIIDTPSKNNTPAGLNRAGDEMGAMQFNFSSYSHHGGTPTVSYLHNGAVPNTYSGGGGVSLTLGLQQHHSGGGGVGLAFTPAAAGSSLFYPRDEMEDCQTVEYSMLENEKQNLQYRNLMDAQLLHDLAG